MMIAKINFVSLIVTLFSVHGAGFVVRSKTPQLSRPVLHMQSASASGPVAVDVAVLGSGIAGATIAYLLQEQQSLSVALIDPR